MAETPLAWVLLDALRDTDEEIREAFRDRGVQGIRPSLARAMMLIDRSGTRLGELAGRAGVTKQAMMQVVDELGELGLTRRVVDPADGRAKLVKLTAKGLRQRAEARRGIASVEARARRRLGPRRLELLKRMLEELKLEGE